MNSGFQVSDDKETTEPLKQILSVLGWIQESGSGLIKVTMFPHQQFSKHKESDLVRGNRKGVSSFPQQNFLECYGLFPLLLYM